MSKFKVINKGNAVLFFELSLPQEEKVSRTNVVSSLLKSIIALCFPGEDKFHKSYPILSLKEIDKLKKENAFIDLFYNLEGYDFDYTDLEMVSINTYLMHKFVDDIVISVSKIKNLPVSENEASMENIHFKALYKATLTSNKWIDFLPDGFLLEMDYMYFHDPEDNNQDEGFHNLYNI